MTRKSLVVAAVVLGLLVGSVGIAYAITNGQPDGNDHPYVGLLVFDAWHYDASGTWVYGPAWRCSGSLIAPDVVLTAGHCTDGALAARVWFDEDVTYAKVPYPLYPFGGPGSGAIEGTPFTNPDFCIGCGNGLPGFAYRDTGVVVLDEPVIMDEYAKLPDAGLVDTLRNKTGIDFVGYGVQEQVMSYPGQNPYDRWQGLRVRLYAPSQLVSGNFVHSDEFMKLSLNAAKGDGGTCFGDSGGPDLLGGTDTVLAVNSYVTNVNCSGVGYSARVDIPEVLEWIEGFMGE
jgi:hypothetical protein